MTKELRSPFFVRDKKFYRTVLAIALPVTLQNVMQLLLNMMDTVMLGQYGENTENLISAAELANKPYFVYTLFMFGIVSGVSVLISQYWGKEDTDTINSVVGIAFTAALSICAVYTTVCYLFTDKVMGLFTGNPEVIALGVDYLKYVLASYAVASVTILLCGVLRSTAQVVVTMTTNAIAILCNIILNYILIFGKLGFSPMGIEGAAIATLIARIFELCLILFYIIFREKKVKLSLKRMFSIDKPLVRDFIRYCLPVICNETLWGLGVTLHAAIIGHMDDSIYSPTAAYSVANIIEKIGLLAAMGFASAAQIIIGKEIGAGRKHNAYPYARTMLFLAVLFGIFMSGIVLLIRGPVIGFFNIDESTKAAAINIISVMSFVIFAKSFNYTAIVGVIRGGGDTLSAMFIDFLPMWLLTIPLGALAAHAFGLPVWWVYAVLMCDEIIKVVVCLIRIKSKKWIRDVTR